MNAGEVVNNSDDVSGDQSSDASGGTNVITHPSATPMPSKTNKNKNSDKNKNGSHQESSSSEVKSFSVVGLDSTSKAPVSPLVSLSVDSPDERNKKCARI